MSVPSIALLRMVRKKNAGTTSAFLPQEKTPLLGNYFPTAYKVASCSTQRIPLSGTSASVFSFTGRMKTVPSLLDRNTFLVLCLPIWVLGNALCSHHDSLLFFYLYTLLYFSLVLGNLGQYLGIGVEMIAIMVVIIRIGNLKKNTDSNLVLKFYYVLKDFQVLLSKYMGVL